MAAVSELVSGLDAELVRLGYKPSTMVWYRGCWRRLEAFFASRGVQEFSLDVAMGWVDQACGGFFDKEQAGTLKTTDVYLFRVAAMLDDFAVYGAVLRRYSRTVDNFSAAQADTLARFKASLQAAGCAVSTVRAYGTVAGEFLVFTETRGGLVNVGVGSIDAFVATLAGYQAKTVEHKLCALRSLLRFAAGDGLVDATVLEAVPAAKSTKQARIPSVWDPADVAKILAAVDRGNPCGKRDYAIILLITRLGLRGVDVKRLRFADLDWPGNRLSVVQAKTGRRVQLPLLKDVGWAIIDYVQHGRPRSECPQVFLRHTAPIGPFSDQDHLHQILVKHARAAHVPLGEERRHGMHSLRHTLATRLLEDGTPVEQIADILGHQQVASTGVGSLRQKVRDLTHRTSQQKPRDVLIRLNQIMRGWANYFQHAVCKHTLDSLENIVWHRVVRWWMRLRRWNWKSARRHLIGRNGRWTRPTVDGIELLNIASVPVTRYRYRGTKIPNPWLLPNHA